MKSAIDANLISLPMPVEYQDVHLIASLLKAYLRSLPEPLLTHKYYDDFIKASQMPSEKDRKSSILKTIQELKVNRVDYYTNLRFLMRFLTKLSDNNLVNKMSTQNIAIVMSPNLLWPRDSNDESNYALQVNSTASGNAIVEILVADWSYFFGEDDVDFFDGMTQEKFLPENGAHSQPPLPQPPHPQPPPPPPSFTLMGDSNLMTRSFNAPNQSHVSSNSNISFPSSENSGKHSRTGSHDTSQIITDPMKKSQSNSSLSDHSSPTHGSPRPNARNKKKAPPTPATGPHIPRLDDIAFIDSEDMHPEETKTTMRGARSTENLLRPDKPSRPAVSTVECQTMHRSVNRPHRPIPVAAPRHTLFKSNDEDEVVLRQSVIPHEKPLSIEKPSIPERPTNIKRASYRGPNANEKSESVDGIEPITFKTPLAKSNSVQPNEKPALLIFGSGGPAVLERTKVYNIDKDHTEIVNMKASPGYVPPPLVLTNNENSQNINCKFIQNELNDNSSLMTSSLTADSTASATSPSSPRNFDAKGEKPKRPQVPPPAAPPNRPKSDSDSTSTNL